MTISIIFIQLLLFTCTATSFVRKDGYSTLKMQVLTELILIYLGRGEGWGGRKTYRLQAESSLESHINQPCVLAPCSDSLGPPQPDVPNPAPVALANLGCKLPVVPVPAGPGITAHRGGIACSAVLS